MFIKIQPFKKFRLLYLIFGVLEAFTLLGLLWIHVLVVKNKGESQEKISQRKNMQINVAEVSPSGFTWANKLKVEMEIIF